MAETGYTQNIPEVTFPSEMDLSSGEEGYDSPYSCWSDEDTAHNNNRQLMDELPIFSTHSLSPSGRSLSPIDIDTSPPRGSRGNSVYSTPFSSPSQIIPIGKDFVTLEEIHARIGMTPPADQDPERCRSPRLNLETIFEDKFLETPPKTAKDSRSNRDLLRRSFRNRPPVLGPLATATAPAECNASAVDILGQQFGNKLQPLDRISSMMGGKLKMSEFELADYKVLDKIGEGSFSEVYRVKHKQTGLYFAAKKLLKTYVDPIEVLECSETQVMKVLDYHPNVVSFVDILHDELTGNLTLIMELMDMSMYDYIKNRKRCLSEKLVKRFLFQIVSGLDHLHRRGIIHRDIKPENILIKIPHKLKEMELVQLADFGSICKSDRKQPYSAYISTRWYRSPECLLTSGYYGPKMDIWAVGCCFYEMLTLKPLFPGENELDQLFLIHEVVGSPSASMLAKIKHLDGFNYEFPKRKPAGFRVLIPLLSHYGVDILNRTLAYVPDVRMSTSKLLQHVYFEDICRSQKASRRSSSMQCLDDVGDGPGTKGSSLRKRTQSSIGSTESLNRSLHSKSSSALGSTASSKTNGTRCHQQRPTPAQQRNLATEMIKHKNLERMWGMNPGPGKTRLEQQFINVSTRG